MRPVAIQHFKPLKIMKNMWSDIHAIWKCHTEIIINYHKGLKKKVSTATHGIIIYRHALHFKDWLWRWQVKCECCGCLCCNLTWSRQLNNILKLGGFSFFLFFFFFFFTNYRFSNELWMRAPSSVPFVALPTWSICEIMRLPRPLHASVICLTMRKLPPWFTSLSDSLSFSVLSPIWL